MATLLDVAERASRGEFPGTHDMIVEMLADGIAADTIRTEVVQALRYERDMGDAGADDAAEHAKYDAMIEAVQLATDPRVPGAPPVHA